MSEGVITSKHSLSYTFNLIYSWWSCCFKEYFSTFRSLPWIFRLSLRSLFTVCRTLVQALRTEFWLHFVDSYKDWSSWRAEFMSPFDMKFVAHSKLRLTWSIKLSVSSCKTDIDWNAFWIWLEFHSEWLVVFSLL